MVQVFAAKFERIDLTMKVLATMRRNTSENKTSIRFVITSPVSCSAMISDRTSD